MEGSEEKCAKPGVLHLYVSLLRAGEGIHRS